MADKRQNQKILVVDDEPANISMLTNGLKKESYVVFFATKGEDALEIADREMPDLILLDIMMPGMDGFEVYSRIKINRKTMNIPVMFVTALNRDGDQSRGLEMGAVDYIIKPFNLPIVKARIKNHLELKKQRDELTALARELSRQMRETERAQEALRQAQKMEAVGTLAGGVAHHFNNILCGIMGYTELVLGRLTRDELSRVYLRKALKSSLRARDLVAQLLDFSRQDESVRKPIDASLPVYETLNHLKTAAPDNVEIKMRINDDECMVRANPDRLRQVGINLCTNALQALEGNDGVVEVSLEPVQLEDDAATELGTDPGPYVLFSVADSGIGIPAAAREHVFEPFFTTREVGQGTGLGLAMVYGIVTGYRGAVTVDSVPGQGSTFKVYLPRC